MPHPDLNELRKQATEYKMNSSKQSKQKTERKIYFLIALLIVFSFLYFYQWDLGKIIFTFASNPIEQQINEEVPSEIVEKKRNQKVLMKPLPIQYLVVLTNGANICREPGLDSSIVSIAIQKDRLTYLRKFQKKEDAYWLLVQAPSGHVGWINAKMVKWDEESITRLTEYARENVTAMKELAIYYEKGLAIEKNKRESYFWYKKAANNGKH